LIVLVAAKSMGKKGATETRHGARIQEGERDGQTRARDERRSLPLRNVKDHFMKRIFADTSYCIALLNPRDELDDRAVAAQLPDYGNGGD
jgi:hypothetical protein